MDFFALYAILLPIMSCLKVLESKEIIFPALLEPEYISSSYVSARLPQGMERELFICHDAKKYFLMSFQSWSKMQ